MKAGEFGAVIEAIAVPGIGIEATAWTSPDEPDAAARVVQIFVHGVTIPRS